MRIALLLLALSLPAVAQDAGGGAPASAPPTSLYAVGGVDVDAILARLTLEEKVGQLLFLGFGGTTMDDTISSFLKQKKPGGVALFSRNIKSVPQTLKLIRDVRKYDPAGIPMFVSVDQEGGRVVRLTKETTVPPSNMAIGATGSEELARKMGESLGRDLALLGFNMNLAPVLDVNSNPKNPVIGIRSFGEDPGDVARLGVAYTLGLQSQGVSAVAKHFPGHGDTAEDSHHAMPALDHDKARLYELELAPFRRALAEGLDALMTAHISLPKIAEEPGMPATVSKNVLTGILRDELGYGGLVITDGLEMEGIVSVYGSGEAAVRAVEAGADMVMVLWFKEKKNEVHKALLDAVKSGRISEARLDQSVRRVLVTKARRGIFAHELLPASKARAALKSASRDVVREVAESALTLVKNEGGAVPLDPSVKTVAMSTEPGFLRALAKGAKVKTMRLPSQGRKRAKAASAKAVRFAQGAQNIIVGTRTADTAVIVRALREKYPEARVIVVSFGSPYMLAAFPSVDAYLCAYAFRGESQVAAARALTGELRPKGRLPVSVNGFKRGHGLELSAELK
jgi:beta-N-acetylhexosaminidase